MDLSNWTSDLSFLDFTKHGFQTGAKFSVRTDEGIIENSHYEGWELFGKNGKVFQALEYKMTTNPNQLEAST